MLTLFVLLITILIYLGILILKKKKRKLLILFIPILIFFVYSYFFSTGSVRLQIALMGHSIDAYKTGLVKNFTTGNKEYYMPTKNIQTTSGSMGYIECKTYGIIKMSKYYGA